MTETAPKTRSVTAIGDLPELYFREAEKTFTRAAANAGGTREFFIELAGLKICLRAAGGALLPRIVGTLAHLEIGNDAPVDLTICCWDAKATGAELPLPARWILDRATFYCLSALTDDRFRTFYIHWMPILSCVDTQSHTAYCCYVDTECLFMMYEVSGPLRALLNCFLNLKGMQMIHASAAGTARGSVLFAGAPGSGKSTLAVLCLQDGLGYQSDDLCVLTAEEQPKSLSLYNMAKLREDAIPRFEALHPFLTHFQEGGEKKAFFYVHEHFPRQVLKEAPVRAVLLPRVTGEASSRLEPAKLMEAVRAVIAWSVKEVPKSDSVGERIMLQAVSRLPAWHLHLGRDDRQTLSLIRSLLHE